MSDHDRPAKMIEVHGRVQAPCINCGTAATAIGSAPLNPDGSIAFDQAKTWGGTILCDACRQQELNQAARDRKLQDKFANRKLLP